MFGKSSDVICFISVQRKKNMFFLIKHIIENIDTHTKLIYITIT